MCAQVRAQMSPSRPEAGTEYSRGPEPHGRRAARPLGDRPAGVSRRDRLPAVVREGLVGLRHAVDVVLALVGVALLLDRVRQLVGEPLGHVALAAGAGVVDEPADGERAGAARGHLDRHLVGGAADAAGADLQHGGERLDARLELLDGGLAGALPEDGECLVDDLLGGGLLAVRHHLVDDLLNEAAPVDGIRLDRTDLGSGAAGHYLALTPYCERAFLRSLTPAASSVPRITL